ncbi:putative alpha/beta-hydrolase family hydrolase [Microbacterium paludicola]|uniref:Alpha/beta-hydrolase family hydrolase n=1 Tax=Microbacterium paludicola TaxID=300019 RepID=A0ABU1HXY6_9MICO|nr:alpha/beta family hydrolase [Microbacterium paludicola]MDR6166510.1 putative alpha/beta-hydrolase family hydrolase [Microbacterium paludicola]
MIDAVSVDVAAGTVELPLLHDRAHGARAVMILAHGAGAGPAHPFLGGFARVGAAAGVDVVRFPFPYIVAGRRLPGSVTDALASWTAVFRAIADAHPGVPIVAAGKSYGGRMASMAAATGAIDPALLVYLGYPLHPPGRPDRPRADHLPAVAAPQLFVSGTRDPFVEPVADLEAIVSTCTDAELLWVEGARHSFEVSGRRLDAEEIGASTAELIVPRCLRRVSA